MRCHIKIQRGASVLVHGIRQKESDVATSIPPIKKQMVHICRNPPGGFGELTPGAGICTRPDHCHDSEAVPLLPAGVTFYNLARVFRILVQSLTSRQR
jgi:hypothetical protein